MLDARLDVEYGGTVQHVQHLQNQRPYGVRTYRQAGVEETRPPPGVRRLPETLRGELGAPAKIEGHRNPLSRFDFRKPFHTPIVGSRRPLNVGDAPVRFARFVQSHEGGALRGARRSGSATPKLATEPPRSRFEVRAHRREVSRDVASSSVLPYVAPTVSWAYTPQHWRSCEGRGGRGEEI